MKHRSNFKDAPHASAIVDAKLMIFQGAPHAQRDFIQNFQDAPHGSAFFKDGVAKPIPKPADTST